MDIRHAVHPRDAKHYTTQDLRENFLIDDLFESGHFKLVYSHYDRLIMGGIDTVSKDVVLEVPETKTEYFLERREMAFVNISYNNAIITVEGKEYTLKNKDCLYIGRSNKHISVKSATNEPARLYFVSTTAHTDYPTTLIDITKATPEKMGSKENCNERTIYKYIHEAGMAKSCQLMLGITILESGSIWNTMPAHLHDRRMEAYLYMDLPEKDRVFHMMGEPEETRHIVVKNNDVVISPNWSIHSGVATCNYAFLWAMGGENYTFKDQDMIAIGDLK